MVAQAPQSSHLILEIHRSRAVILTICTHSRPTSRVVAQGCWNGAAANVDAAVSLLYHSFSRVAARDAPVA